MGCTMAGYDSLRGHITTAWHHLALYDELGAEVTRIDTATDPRVTITENEATGRIAITMNAAAEDPDIGYPRSITGAALRNDAAIMIRDTITPAVFDQPDDTHPFTFTLGVPEMISSG